MKKSILALLTLTIIGCGSSGDSAVNTATETPSDGTGYKIIFKESFENTPDWVSSSKNPNGDLEKPITNKAPINWNFVRSEPAWSPSRGHNDRHEPIEIKEHALEKIKTGKKSAVFYRDLKSTPSHFWWSDGILVKTLDKEYKQLYVEFYTKFSPNFIDAPVSISKIFRILHHIPGTNPFQGFETSTTNPTIGWNYYKNNYGLRNCIWLRGYPPSGDGDNYYFYDEPILGLPRQLQNGDLALNFIDEIRDLNGDGTPDNEITKLLSMVDGKPIGDNPNRLVNHDDLWGNKTLGGKWRKVAFFVKMNSKPGATDGVLIQWIDDQLLFKNENIPFIGKKSPHMLYWNTIKIGGNDFFSKTFDDSSRPEDWFAIDDIMVATDMPENLKQ